GKLCVEVGKGYADVIEGEGRGSIRFSGFDDVHLPDTSQEEVFNTTVRPLVADVIKGFNCTVLAHGQTGSGKTYTMEGGPGSKRGTIPRAAELLFQSMNDQQQAWLQVSLIEIYLEKIRDLLNPK
ncbi:unnamed protein product, partial [Chrysoparadoxa australica]